MERTALITGASSGIGLELARLFARDGYAVVLVARRETPLRALAAELARDHGVRCEVVVADLALPAAPAQVMQAVADRGLRIGALVNNAGFATFGPFATTDLGTEMRLIQVNVAALTELTKRALPGMLADRDGLILNVASTAAFQPGPLMAVYYATKAYVLSFSEALANELAGSGVRVTALCPGPTASGFVARAQLESSRLVYGKKLANAASVARAGYAGAQRGRRIVIPGVRNWILVQLVRIFPRTTVTRIVRGIQERVRA